MIQWSSPEGKLKGSVRDRLHVAGFAGRAIRGHHRQPGLHGGRLRRASQQLLRRQFQGLPLPPGVLSHARNSELVQPRRRACCSRLPGADDARFVQMGAVWSPDGQYLVFARATGHRPQSAGRAAGEIRQRSRTSSRSSTTSTGFRSTTGEGGAPEPIAGASRNGMSNTFPKVSPDGRWIVFVQCRNGELMRPDSQLYIVPAEGGTARRMRCNTTRMNSWHSFSPNGRWMVFSSKARSPYTQMYLTHLDADGNDSPPILIDNATAANRAANIPEFVNIQADGSAANRRASDGLLPAGQQRGISAEERAVRGIRREVEGGAGTESRRRTRSPQPGNRAADDRPSRRIGGAFAESRGDQAARGCGGRSAIRTRTPRSR